MVRLFQLHLAQKSAEACMSLQGGQEEGALDRVSGTGVSNDRLLEVVERAIGVAESGVT